MYIKLAFPKKKNRKQDKAGGGRSFFITTYDQLFIGCLDRGESFKFSVICILKKMTEGANSECPC